MIDAKHGEESGLDVADLERFLASMAPPETIGDTLEEHPEISAAFASQNLVRLTGVLAGLSTEPRFQANLVRLDWATRLALIFSRGRKSVRSRHISSILNQAFVAANINALEDPIESPFIDRISTARGDRLMIGGLWESAAFYTECTLRAFENLPDHDIKTDALGRAYALLDLAHQIALASSYPPNCEGGNEPRRFVTVPHEARLRSLSQRVYFSTDDIKKLGIAYADLLPFVITEAMTANLVNREIGNSTLEFMPLLAVNDGILVASPQNLTTAIRADLVSTALTSGMRDQFKAALLFTQADMLKTTHFLGDFRAQYYRDADLHRREVWWEEPNGCWVHVIQVSDHFYNWPESSFGSACTFNDEQFEVVNRSIIKVRDFCEARSGFVKGITILLLSGIGRGWSIDHRVGPDRDGWKFLPLNAADAVVVGLVEHGKLSDVWRLTEIAERTSAMGFEIFSANGLLNQFQWWKDNKFKLVPEGQLDIQPPALINFETNRLLKPRIEAAQAADARTLKHQNLGIRRVFRKSRSDRNPDYDILYADVEATENRLPRVAAVVGSAVWWIELNTEAYEGRIPEEIFRTWDGLTHWAARCLEHLSKLYELGDEQVCFRLTIAPSPDQKVLETPTDPIETTVTMACEVGNRGCEIELKTAWHKYLFRPDNLAERYVAARFIEAFIRLSGRPLDDIDCGQLALDAVGSPHYRWRHIIEARTPSEHLKHLGLAGEFRPISPSAGALIQLGTCWEVRERSDGARIEGYEHSLEFIRRYYEHLLGKLISGLRTYDRASLLGYALASVQSAEGELSHWSTTAGAMRAIHGEAGDHNLSMERRSQAYGVLRASTIILEVALCEAGKDGDKQPGQLDYEELQALALMTFEVADLHAGLRYHRIEPRVHISPTGELLTNHEFEERTLKAAGHKLNLKNRLTDAERYIARFQSNETADPDESFQQAVQAEFGAPWQGVIDLSIASAHIAAERRAGILKLRKSEFLDELSKFEPLVGVDVAPTIDRLSLIPRPAWFERPDDWTINDIDLARLGRRYGFISRPIILLDGEVDPLLLISPSAIFRSTMFILGGAMDGSLQNEYWQTEAMRRYASNAGNLAGNRFNEKVTQVLNSIGLEARSSVKPSWCLNVKVTEDVQRLGDVDSLALDRKTNTVWIVEAKDLQVCRTLGEAARRLSEYQGKADERGRPDKLMRHLNRVGFIRERAQMLCNRLKLESAPTVKGLVVIRAPQPFADISADIGEDAQVVMLDQLAGFLSR